MSIPFKVKSNRNFSKRVMSTVDAWEAAPATGARLVVPDELSWWYWQEFGTGSMGDAGKASGVPYAIDPQQGTYLVFPGPGGKTFSKGVVHPGIKPRRMVSQVMSDIDRVIAENSKQAFLNGALFNPQILQDALGSSMEEAKRIIVESIRKNVTGTRVNTDFPNQSGRLDGRTAADVFDELATVVEIK